jgi:GDP-L-fucose synthase
MNVEANASLFNLKGLKVFVAGHKGMVGQALVRRLSQEEANILTADRNELNLINQNSVKNWMNRERPDVIFLAAAKVGGILANDSFPAQFLYENLMIESNVIHAAHMANVKKLVFLGSTCIYPKFAPQPISEDSLLSGPLEPTNEWYAIAKIAGIKMCQAYRKQYGRDFISVQPTNLYGPGDNYDLNNSHVLPALLKKAYISKNAGDKEMVVWGTGSPLREFMHVDDLADAIVHVTRCYSGSLPINLGSGQEISIGELAILICRVVGFEGSVLFDTTKPDGTPRKRADISRLTKLGWSNSRDLESGLRSTYADALLRNTFK